MSAENVSNISREIMLQMVEQNAQLVAAIQRELANGSAASSQDQIAAGLKLAEVLSRSVREIVEGYGGTVLIQAAGTEPQQVVEANVTPTKPEVPPIDSLRPRTYRELLEQKIEAFLPPQDPLSMHSVDEAIGVRKGYAQKFASFLYDQRVDITVVQPRAEVSRLFYIYLSTPGSAFTRDQQAYTKAELKSIFAQSYPDLLDRWSSEVGFNWKETPTVDRENAFAVRGLVSLNRILENKSYGSPRA